MQNKDYEVIKNEVKTELSNHFKDKLERTFTIESYMEHPHIEFRMEFTLYNFFDINFEYDRGRFGCSILNGKYSLELENSQKWYDEADMKIFCKELDEQLRLRIPDKYLAYHGWL